MTTTETQVVTKGDVARAAGVSERTVHRVINDPGVVDLETSVRVWTAIEELGYTGEPARRGRRPSEVPLVHPISLRVDAWTRAELARRAALLTSTHGQRTRGWDAEIVRQALDWAFRPPEGVKPMPDDYLGAVNRVTNP